MVHGVHNVLESGKRGIVPLIDHSPDRISLTPHPHPPVDLGVNPHMHQFFNQQSFQRRPFIFL